MKTVKVVATYVTVTERTFYVPVAECSPKAMIGAAESIVANHGHLARYVQTVAGEETLKECYSVILP